VIGYALEGLKTLGPVRLAYHWWYSGHRVVVSGSADLAALKSFCERKGLDAGEIGPVDCSDALDGLGVEASLFRPTFGSHVRWAGSIRDLGWVEIEVRPEDGTFLLIAVR